MDVVLVNPIDMSVDRDLEVANRLEPGFVYVLNAHAYLII